MKAAITVSFPFCVTLAYVPQFLLSSGQRVWPVALSRVRPRYSGKSKSSSLLEETQTLTHFCHRATKSYWTVKMMLSLGDVCS